MIIGVDPPARSGTRLVGVEKKFSSRTRIAVLGAGLVDYLFSTSEDLDTLNTLNTLDTLDTLDMSDVSDILDALASGSEKCFSIPDS